MDAALFHYWSLLFFRMKSISESGGINFSFFFHLPLHRTNKEDYIKVRTCGYNMPTQELTDEALN